MTTETNRSTPAAENSNDKAARLVRLAAERDKNARALSVLYRFPQLTTTEGDTK